jgi:hypothetical protein
VIVINEPEHCSELKLLYVEVSQRVGSDLINPNTRFEQLGERFLTSRELNRRPRAVFGKVVTFSRLPKVSTSCGCRF